MAKKPTDDVGKARSDELGKAQWKRIAATVKPLGRKNAIKSPARLQEGLGVGQSAIAVSSPSSSEEGLGWCGAASISAEKAHPAATKLAFGSLSLTAPPVNERRKKTPTATLDGSWDRRIRTGRIEPDFTIDLHGHTLAGAHSQLARALDRAVGQGARVILLIAGKQRGPDEAPRGAIRRELESWLNHSRHADKIAAVRNAHPRHGGAGALYLILKR